LETRSKSQQLPAKMEKHSLDGAMEQTLTAVEAPTQWAQQM
jgi:hypothetical protein